MDMQHEQRLAQAAESAFALKNTLEAQGRQVLVGIHFDDDGVSTLIVYADQEIEGLPKFHDGHNVVQQSMKDE